MKLSFFKNLILVLFPSLLALFSYAQQPFVVDNFEGYTKIPNSTWQITNSGATNNTFQILDTINSVYSIDGNSLQTCTVTLENGNQPGYTYAGNVQSEIVYREFPTTDYFNIKLGFEWKCNGEQDNDYGTLHYKKSLNDDWQVLKRYQSGKGNEVMTEMIQLPKCSENGSFYIGFSFTSDNSFNFQPGLVIDNLKIYGNNCISNDKPAKPTPDKDYIECFNDRVKVILTSNSQANSLRWYLLNECSEILYEGKNYSVLPMKSTTFYVTSYDTITGCESVNKSQVVLNVRPLPKIDIYGINDVSLGNDGSFKVKVTGTPPMSLYYSTNDTTLPEISTELDSFEFNNKEKGIHKFILTDMKNSENKCTFSKDFFLSSGDNLYIPKGISPNNDELNDTWEIQGVQQWEDFSVELRNMRGELVYRQDATDNPSYVPMDGKDSNGIKLPPGDYTYVIRSKSRKRNYSGILSIKYD